MPTDLLLSLSSAGIPASALSTALGKLSASDIASIEGGQGFTVYYKDEQGNIGTLQEGNFTPISATASISGPAFLASINAKPTKTSPNISTSLTAGTKDVSNSVGLSQGPLSVALSNLYGSPTRSQSGIQTLQPNPRQLLSREIPLIVSGQQTSNNFLLSPTWTVEGAVLNNPAVLLAQALEHPKESFNALMSYVPFTKENAQIIQQLNQLAEVDPKTAFALGLMWQAPLLVAGTVSAGYLLFVEVDDGNAWYISLIYCNAVFIYQIRHDICKVIAFKVESCG